MNGKDFAQDAADRLNAACLSGGPEYVASDYGVHSEFTLLADTLAELAAAKSDMGKIDRIAESWNWRKFALHGTFEAATIAAKHCPAPDPLVEAFREIQRTPMPPADQWPEQMARDLRAELERLGNSAVVEKVGRVSVPDSQTPLNDDLGHRLLDVLKEGQDARDNGTPNPYHGHSLEHCLHAFGWVLRDLRIALDKCKAELERRGHGGGL